LRGCTWGRPKKREITTFTTLAIYLLSGVYTAGINASDLPG